MTQTGGAGGWIDVSRPMQEGMVHWPGDRPFERRREGRIRGPGTCNTSSISCSVHIGTHIDAPLHFIADGPDIDSLGLDALCGPARVVQIDAPRDVAAADLDGQEIKPGDRVLFKTPNQARWASGAFDTAFHAIGADAARWLVQRGVVAVGIDYLSIDPYDSTDKPAHYALLGAGVVVIEGLDLSQVGPGRYEMVALPLRLVGSDGSPARVILRPL
jgi:arylformamidase